MSGYPLDVVRAGGLVSEDLELIMKPVSPQALLRKVRSILDD